MKKFFISIVSILLTNAVLLSGCIKTEPAPDSSSRPEAVPTTAPQLPTATIRLPTATPISGTGHVDRTLLTFDDLLNGFDFDSPVGEAALIIPTDAAPPTHVFEGRLELKGEGTQGDIQVLRDEIEEEWSRLLVDGEATQGDIQVLRSEFENEWGHLPEFDFAFVQAGSHLIPVQRGSIIADHPKWNYILEPGRVWQERSDNGYSRASFPFALVIKGSNSTFNGTMTFLFDDQNVSKVWYQITQETTSYSRANFWGLLETAYHPEDIANSPKIKADFDQEMNARFPTKPIEALAQDYPEVDLSAFGQGVTPEHMTWFGFVINGVNYIGGCQTRFGIYPYCESMRATSYSTAKSAFTSVAVMRLAQKYGPEVADLLIKDYVPEAADSPGNWDHVTFNHTLDMSTGNYVSPGNQVDEDGPKMNEFFGTQPYAKRIALAFDWPNSNRPGQQWVYRTSDTFILTRALHNYLVNQKGSDSDIFEFVVDEVYQPLGLGPGFFTTMRTSDNGWQGQAEGGYGLWWIPDDIAKISYFLLNMDGQIAGIQVLHPDMLAASLQLNSKDRGVSMYQGNMYNNAFWAFKYANGSGSDCEFWVPMMLGVSGNVIALMPNGTVYYYFSDNREFTWDAAVWESNKLIPFCP